MYVNLLWLLDFSGSSLGALWELVAVAGIFLEGLKAYRIAQTAFTDCMKLQLSFEKWVDDSSSIIDVCGASELLSKLIRSIQNLFSKI